MGALLLDVAWCLFVVGIDEILYAKAQLSLHQACRGRFDFVTAIDLVHRFDYQSPHLYRLQVDQQARESYIGLKKTPVH